MKKKEGYTFVEFDEILAESNSQAVIKLKGSGLQLWIQKQWCEDWTADSVFVRDTGYLKAYNYAKPFLDENIDLPQIERIKAKCEKEGLVTKKSVISQWTCSLLLENGNRGCILINTDKALTPSLTEHLLRQGFGLQARVEGLAPVVQVYTL